jgi:predicted site-specific integrase-resolvase
MVTQSNQTATAETPDFINEKELLKRIPVSRRTAFTWVQSGKLPCVKINRRKLFHWPSVEQALLRQQHGGTE